MLFASYQVKAESISSSIACVVGPCTEPKTQ
jgi:hypothetical protein